MSRSKILQQPILAQCFTTSAKEAESSPSLPIEANRFRPLQRAMFRPAQPGSGLKASTTPFWALDGDAPRPRNP
jgi:hypothetical protein